MTNEAWIWVAVLALGIIGVWKPKVLAAILYAALIVAVACTIGFLGIMLLCALIGGLKKK
jgi:ABC-type transporter Mla maintaining outer membrane lipid asymmetry permease subunit MlaE